MKYIIIKIICNFIYLYIFCKMDIKNINKTIDIQDAKVLLSNSLKGCKYSQYDLGICYQKGFGFVKNLSIAFKWFEKSAESGYDEAQTDLARCYSNGIGTDINKNLAFKWFEKAALQNNHSSQNSLGVCYEKGFGTDKNYTLAFKWFEKAAFNDFTIAQYNLAKYYYKGLGVKKNYKLAFKYCKMSSDKNHVESQYKLAEFYKFGIGTDKNNKKAFELYYKILQNSTCKCNCELKIKLINFIIQYYKKENEIYIEENPNHYSNYSKYKKYSKYLYNIGVCYNMLNDFEKSYDYFEMSADLNFTPAQYELGVFYFNLQKNKFNITNKNINLIL